MPRRRIKSKNRPKGFWAKTENLTNFLTEFAQKHGFDPSDAEAWHNVGYTTLKKSPVSDYSSSLFFILGLNISDPLCFSMIGRKCNVGTFHGFSKNCLRHCFPRRVFPFQGYAYLLWLDYKSGDFLFSEMRPRGFWQDIQNVKEFLTQYATSKGFDPLDKKKWVATSLAEFAQQPVSLRRR